MPGILVPAHASWTHDARCFHSRVSAPRTIPHFTTYTFATSVSQVFGVIAVSLDGVPCHSFWTHNARCFHSRVSASRTVPYFTSWTSSRSDVSFSRRNHHPQSYYKNDSDNHGMVHCNLSTRFFIYMYCLFLERLFDLVSQKKS